jgi:hypothetical protein
MARASAFCTTAAGSTTLPIMSLYAVAAQGLMVREVGVFNTTTTAVRFKLVRLTSAGTPGAALTENKYLDWSGTPVGTAFNTHTGAPSLGTDIAAMEAGAATGAGTILTFYGENNGLLIPLGTANGIGILPLGTGQICDAYIVWDE